MESLSFKTVFHDISLKIDEEDEFCDDGVIPNPAEWETEDEAETEGVTAEGAKPLADSDDEWDTDLEDEGSQMKRHFIRDDQAKNVYMAACHQLNLVPAHCFLKGVNTKSINLNFQGLGPVGTRAVATAMVMDNVSTELLMAGNFIGRDGIRYVCEMLRENEYLTHIDLSENDLGAYAAELLADVFKENDRLVSLKLSGNQFKDKDAEHFAAILAIGQYTGLRKLDLSHNKFGDIGAKILGHAIGDNETLVELNLSWNQIRREGIHEIAKGLGENNCLQVFDISSNGVDDVASGCLGRALVTNRYLRELNLNSNRIGIEGVKNLFFGLAKNENLKILRLSSNPISLEGPLVALTLIRQSEVCVLEDLEIADACVPREFYAVLEEIQKVRPKLKVHVAGYMNTRDMCKAVAKKTQDKWMKDPVLVFINFIEERKLKIFDMFKQFDKDKSCTLTKDEFISGLTKMGCPLEGEQYQQLLNVLDVDRNGEVDLAEFMDGYAIHKRRFGKYQKTGSRVSSAATKSRPPSSQSSSRPSSRLGSGVKRPKVNGENSFNEIDSVQVENNTNQLGDAKPLLDVPGDTPVSQSEHDALNTPDNECVILSVPKGLTVA